ncbi:hypothetical protein NQ315_009633 [Exocentrus adspersus]|uniref:Uncharacterized protein n=1 Tax=Exocentrus adspersus TaxID=1586481 RepID=A0AAV8WH78_9CUCU|nr:hypothetical protein NQ315_009633 [Exocentrus adspersus]
MFLNGVLFTNKAFAKNMESQVEDNIDMSDIKKFLQDADSYEPNMTDADMLQLYRALKDSEKTASEEYQTRKLNESQEELTTLLEEDGEDPETPSLQSNLEHNNNDNFIENHLENAEASILEDIVTDSPKDATKAVFGFNDMLPDSASIPYDHITHELKFVPVHGTSEFLNADTKLKAKMLYAYHTKISKMKTELARMSYYPAPVPKPICITETILDAIDADHSDQPETYICRSGRQTKRKLYNYDNDEEDLDAVLSNKKVKNTDEQEWFSKSTHSKSSARSSKKQDTNKSQNEKSDPESVDTNKEKKTYTKKETKTSSLKKIPNTEIMKRSKLFSDSPKRRCEVLFDKIKEAEEKKAKEEKAMESFNNTLETIDEEIDDDDTTTSKEEEIISVDDHDDFVVRRVPPPLPSRRGAGRKRNTTEGLAPLNVKVNAAKQKDTKTDQNGLSQDREEDLGKFLTRRRPIRRVPTSNASSPLPSTSRPSKAATSDSVTCPICGGWFREDRIEEHAATCGDEPSTVTRSSTKMSRLSCHLCDKVLDFNIDYEEHVKECSTTKN